MTLIVGVICRDGVVIGSDGAATFGYMGKPTIRQKHKKLKIIRGNAILGVSGPVGLGQRFHFSIDKEWGSISSKKPEEAMVAIREILWRDIDIETQIAMIMSQRLQQGAPLSSAISGSILGCSLAGKPYIFSFDQQGAPEILPEDLMFVSIGSGQDIADTFLAFLKGLFWEKSTPNLSEGIFTVLWTLQHAIATNPGGVDYPIQIITVSKRGAWVAHELEEEEYLEQKQQIDDMKEKMREYKGNFSVPLDKSKAPPKIS